MFVIPAVRRLRQEKVELETSLGYIGRPYFQTEQSKAQQNGKQGIERLRGWPGVEERGLQMLQHLHPLASLLGSKEGRSSH